MKRTLFAFSTAALMATGSTGAAEIYSMDFSIAGQGSTHDDTGSDPVESSPVVGSNWTLTFGSPSSDSTTNSFITDGGIMDIDDWGGDGTVTSDIINITGDGTVDIAGVAITDSSGLAFNASSEGFEWFYKLNGGSEVSFGAVGEGFGGSDVGDGIDLSDSVTNIAVSNGDTLEVGFNVNVNGSNDGVDVSSLTVDFIPEPASLALLGLGGLMMLGRRRSA